MKKDIAEQVHDLGYAADIGDIDTAVRRVMAHLDPDESLARFGAREHLKVVLDNLDAARKLLASPDIPD